MKNNNRLEKSYTASDGFTAEIYSRPNLHGTARLYSAWRNGMQLFGMQYFSTLDAAELAIEGHTLHAA